MNEDWYEPERAFGWQPSIRRIRAPLKLVRDFTSAEPAVFQFDRGYPSPVAVRADKEKIAPWRIVQLKRTAIQVDNNTVCRNAAH